MPTYDYACKACDNQFEINQSFTDDPLTTCDQCGGDLRKVFGSIGISFKGSGFYKTDSRPGKKTSTAASSDTPAKSASSDTPAAKPADKPAAKPAAKPKTDS